jgi:lysozyme family protein
LRALFTSNSWGSGKIFRADFNKKRSSEYRAIVDWLQESTGVNFSSTVKLSKEEAKAIEDFYNKDPKRFVREFTKRRKIHNKTLDDYKTFGRGWDKRAKDLERALLSELRKS